MPPVLVHLIIFLSTPLSSASQIHHLIIFFSFSLGDLNTACFFSSQVHCIAPSCSTFQEASRSIDVTSVKILQTRSVLFCLTIFLVRESTLIFQKSCLFQSLIVEMKSKRCQYYYYYYYYFEIQASLVKDPTRVIQ